MSNNDLVVAVCTSRVDDLQARWEHNIAQLDGDEFLVLLDAPETESIRSLAERIRSRGGTVICHGENRGLSAARNTVIGARSFSKILFIDDDVILDRAAVGAIRAAFSDGAQVVGARLIPPANHRSWPWFFTTGEMHLVGWHAPNNRIKTWGSCMGIDAAFACENGLRFDKLLGRTGRRLESGEDTSFVMAMKDHGARETLLHEISVVHDVASARITLAYLLRRAYWQGRSESRRRRVCGGFRKEWRRYQSGGNVLLAILFITAVGIGIGIEWLLRLKRMVVYS